VISGHPLSAPRAGLSSVAGDARADHGRIVDRPPNLHIRPSEIRQWIDARMNLRHILVIDSLAVCYTRASERMLTRMEGQA
jgi:hypothetical protein